MAIERLMLLTLFAACRALGTTVILNPVDSNLGESIAFSDDGNNLTHRVGGVDATVAGNSRVLYCVQPGGSILPGTYDSVLDFADTPSMQHVSLLLRYQAPTTPVTDAGLQLALWDILQDGGDGLESGNVRVAASGTVGQGSTAAIFYNNTLSGAAEQDLTGSWPTDDGPSPAPKPDALPMFAGFALAGLAGCAAAAGFIARPRAGRPVPCFAARHP